MAKLIGWATISACGTYRYTLHRTLATSPPAASRRIVWLMLNPSTADAMNDDSTLEKIQKYGRRWGFHDLDVVNVYAFRATSPMDMWHARKNGTNIVGPDNDSWIQKTVRGAHQVMVGWGIGATTLERLRFHRARTAAMVESLRREIPGVAFFCLGVNGDGSPVHPLYQKDAEPFVPWEVP